MNPAITLDQAHQAPPQKRRRRHRHRRQHTDTWSTVGTIILGFTLRFILEFWVFFLVFALVAAVLYFWLHIPVEALPSPYKQITIFGHTKDGQVFTITTSYYIGRKAQEKYQYIKFKIKNPN